VGAQLLRDVQTFVAAMDSMFGGFRKRADATYKLLQANGTAFLVVAAPERDALREASYFVERLAAEDMPLAGLVLNRVHGSGASQLTAERALAAAEALEDAMAEASTPLPSGEFDVSTENLQNGGIVDQADGKAEVRNSRTADGASPESPPASVSAPVPASASASTSTNMTDTADALAARLLRLHAERMQLVARERRTRDRFVSVHPEVPMVDVPALPGDVHDLAGLREIGERLAQAQPTAA
jgi:anion-transporting  ArsA/GET3 family ATPase